jgi:hypothetical protein
MLGFCDHCKTPLHGSPLVVYDPRGYLYACTTACHEKIEQALERERIAQQSMKYGTRVWNGA